MTYVIRPKVVSQGGKAASDWDQDSALTRLQKYIPMQFAGAYPLLENGLQMIQKDKGGLPVEWGWTVFAVVLLFLVIVLHRDYSSTVTGAKRWLLEAQHILTSAIAFCVWTYSIKSVIWGELYNPGLAIVSAVLFLLFVAATGPKVTIEEAAASGIQKKST